MDKFYFTRMDSNRMQDIFEKIIYCFFNSRSNKQIPDHKCFKNI